MIVLDYEPTPIAIPIGGIPFRIFHPLNREELRAQHPDWWWMYSWSSGILLSLEIVKLPEPKTILEIGCGLGLASLVASKFGHNITCTDLVEETEWYVGHNARSSATKVPRWKKPIDIDGKFDLIIFSDVLYGNYKAPEYLLTMLSTLLSDDGEILCVEPNTLPILDTFTTLLDTIGMYVVEQDVLNKPFFGDAPPMCEENQFVKLRIRRGSQ